MTRVSFGLRLSIAALTVAGAVAAGMLHRSPWIVAVLVVPFTLLYALGKWRAWRAEWRRGGVRAIAAAVAATLPVQAVVAGLLYGVGFGIGALVDPRAVAPLAAIDIAAVVAGSLLAVCAHAIVIRIERDGEVVSSGEEMMTDEDSFAVDPTPLTIDGFALAPHFLHPDATGAALAGRGAGVIDRHPPGASEAMIAAAEARLGVTLPEPLRALYRVTDGGYLDYVYVPRRPHPRPIHSDWRGVPGDMLPMIDQMRTLADHYADFTMDPDDIPADADRRIILHESYSDITLLDYTRGDVPRVLMVDYDRQDDDPVDIEYADYAAFFAAIRRPVPDASGLSRSDPLAGLSPAEQVATIWADAEPHRFFNSAEQAHKPKRCADDALVVETEARLGVMLPPALTAWWRVKNGGEIAWRYLDAPGAPVGGLDIWEHPVPLEYAVSLRTLSDRIAFPPGETPWADLFRDPERLIVLDAAQDRAVMLDYRGVGDDAPAVLVVRRLGDGDASALAVPSIADFFARLRRYQWRG